MSINPTTGALVTGFTANADAKVGDIAVTNTTVYMGGTFHHVNGAAKGGLAAVNINTGAVVQSFSNDLSGGIGTNGTAGVQRLVITPDLTKLLVVHTAKQIAGQDRYGAALINTTHQPAAALEHQPLEGQPPVRRWHPARVRRCDLARRQLLRRDQRVRW